MPTGVSVVDAFSQRAWTSLWFSTVNVSFPLINVCTTEINESSCLFDMPVSSAISANVNSACDEKGSHGLLLRRGAGAALCWPKSSKDSILGLRRLFGWYSVRISSIWGPVLLGTGGLSYFN